MKSRILIVFCMFFAGLSVFAEKKTEDKKDESSAQLDKAIDYCKEIAILYDSVSALNDSIEKMNFRLDSLKSSWREICEKAIKNGATKSVIQELLKNTDRDFDGDLYTLLEDALRNAEESPADNVEPVGIVPADPDKQGVKIPKENDVAKTVSRKKGTHGKSQGELDEERFDIKDVKTDNKK